MKRNFTFNKCIDASRLVDISQNPISTIGSFGVVYKGKFNKKKHSSDQSTNKKENLIDCAIKYLISNNLNQDFSAFHKEIKTQNLIKHPAILELLGYIIPFCGVGRLTIVTPFMEKGSLRNVLIEERKGNAPEGWDSTKKMINIIGIAAGLHRMHKVSLIHRDIKPENILLDNDLYPKICDFGYSKVFEEGRDEIIQRTYCGSESYMAPELLSRSEYNGTVDVYAYGVVLYELLTNETYFEKLAKDRIEFINVVINGKRPNISKDIRFKPFFRKLISECWNKDPKVRPFFDDILRSLLEAYKKRILIPLKNEINEYILKTIDASEFDIEFAEKLVDEEIEEEEEDRTD